MLVLSVYVEYRKAKHEKTSCKINIHIRHIVHAFFKTRFLSDILLFYNIANGIHTCIHAFVPFALPETRSHHTVDCPCSHSICYDTLNTVTRSYENLPRFRGQQNYYTVIFSRLPHFPQIKQLHGQFPCRGSFVSLYRNNRYLYSRFPVQRFYSFVYPSDTLFTQYTVTVRYITFRTYRFRILDVFCGKFFSFQTV